MSKKKQKQAINTEPDSTYLLKLVLYIVLGSLWIKFAAPIEIGIFVLGGFPVGLVLGLIFASHDHFQVDRKVEYALLLLMTVITYFLPAGIVI